MRGRKPGVMTKEQMREPSASVTRLVNSAGDPYKKLAGAIICVAADDYRLALDERNDALRVELEKFFHSEWYKVLCNLDPDKLMADIRVEHKLAKAASF